MNAVHPAFAAALAIASGDLQRKATRIDRGPAVPVTGSSFDAVIAAMDAIDENGSCRIEVVKARAPVLGRAIVAARLQAANDAPREYLPRMTVDEAAQHDPKHWWEKR